MIDKSFIKDHDYYMLFGYNSKEYLTTGDFSESILGNYPLILDKRNLNVYRVIDLLNEEIVLDKMIELSLVKKICPPDGTSLSE
ncbi:hypothetical protein [Tenacibaculum halocynthiae]|uniref:hypothetical protein n=1 Tax=Tenacibaculum halocynthiae TaxID=1254437 RepID=UPI0038936B01